MASTHKNIFASHGFLASHAGFEAGISKSRVRLISQPNASPQTMVIGMILGSLGNERKPRPFCAFRVSSVSSIDSTDMHRVIPENSLDCVVSGQGLHYGMGSLNSLDYVGSQNGFDCAGSEKGSGYVVPESGTIFNVSKYGKDINDCVFLGGDEDRMAPPTPIIDVEGENTKGLNISKLGLEKELVEALRKRGITNMFPIQEAVFKPAIGGLDIIGRARTGTGKTMAFGIPIIQSLLKHNKQNRTRNPRALVLAPTRELAMQVEKEFMESTTNLSTICVYGGVSIAGQQRKLERGVDIAVGTPGRIIDLIERGSLVLNEVRYLVLDESDQMLAVGFAEDVERILESVPKERQSMLFSATMPDWVKQLARKHLKKPLTIDLVGDSKEKLAEGIRVLSIAIPVSAKRSVLSDLITVYSKGRKTIVFTQTKKDADEISLSLNRVLGAEALHGDITQVQREKTLAAFQNGKFSVLVATDVAARGLDVANVDLVIHFEIPNDSETFVHRSGRTGRAGKAGITILMYTDSQIRTVKMIERDIGCKFELIKAPSPHDFLRASSEQALEALNRVHPELRSAFLPMAKMLLQEQGAHALAAAIAYISGFIQPPLSKSLATQEQLSNLQHDEDPWERYGRFAVQGGRMERQYGRPLTSGNRGPYRREELRSGIRDQGSNGNGHGVYQGGNVGYQGISVVYRGIDGKFQRSIPSCFICGNPGHKAAVCPKRSGW